MRHTFKWWSNHGFKILKGSKHVDRNKIGECLFSKNQVVKCDAVTIWTNDEGDGCDEDVPHWCDSWHDVGPMF